MSRKKIKDFVYERRIKELRSIVKFGFGNRKHFSPQQKSAVTRQWVKYHSSLKLLRENKAKFKKASRSQIKAMKSQHIRSTNKGIIVLGMNPEIPRKQQKVTLSGKGKKVKLRVRLITRTQTFFPYEFNENESFVEFTIRLFEKYKPDFAMIKNVNGTGLVTYKIGRASCRERV